jgi:acyl-CoA synthetase (AMP-forming)/AMP-acid ligase II
VAVGGNGMAAVVFAVHGYPIGNGVSTFIVETDERSWREAGLDAFDVSQPPGPSDQVTQAYLGVARFKWPERLEIVAELPVTKLGKLDKKALRDWLGRSTA